MPFCLNQIQYEIKASFKTVSAVRRRSGKKNLRCFSDQFFFLLMKDCYLESKILLSERWNIFQTYLQHWGLWLMLVASENPALTKGKIQASKGVRLCAIHAFRGEKGILNTADHF